MRLIGKLVLTFVMLSAMFTGIACAQLDMQNPLVGKQAPDFTAETVQGHKLALMDLINGRKSIVFFFATWCPHCREQLEALEDRKAEIEKQGVEVVLVDVSERKELVARFLKSRGITRDALIDADGAASELYQVYGIPSIYYIAADGIVRRVEYGFLENYADILK